MAKTLRTAALVVGAVALVAATAGAAAGALAPAMAGTAGIGTVSAATLTAVGTYASLAAGALSIAAQAAMPGPTVQGSATTFATNPQSGLPYAMGRTRMSGLRFFAATSNTPGYTKANDLLWFGALLSIGGQIEQIETFKADNVVVSFDAGGNAIGTYRNYMAQKVHLGGPQASAINLSLNGGTPPGWTSQHRLSGITHAMWGLRFDKDGELYGAGAPEPAWIGKWVRVYDPRLDSTYPGGAGPCRALDEGTYVWSQNPGLHALTWALGRWQNGKRTCGIGAPIANIRVAEFVECANICDANGWKVGGVEWTTDSKWATMKRILQAGGARPTKSRGMIGCLVSAPRTAIATIESWHLLDKLQINVTKSRRDRFNTVIPRFVDEASDWAMVSGTSVSVADYVTADRGPRTKEIDYPLVQVFAGEEAKQPAELAAYDIVNSREAGPFTWSTGPEWIGIKTGDVINLNVPEEGLVNQPMLITKAAPDPATGKILFAGDTETHSKHDFALGRTTTPPPPFALTAPDLKPPAPTAGQWVLSGSTTGEGLPCLVLVGAPDHPSAESILVDYRTTGSAEWTQSAILPARASIVHIIAPLASDTLYEARVGYRVGGIDGDYTVLPAVRSGVGKLAGIEDGATKGAPPGTSVNGRPVEAVIYDLDLNGQNWFEMASLESTRDALMLARTTLDGQPIGTVVAQFKADQTTANSATAENFALLGAKAGDGQSWNLNIDTVRVGPVGGSGPWQSLSQRFSSISSSLGANSGAINDLREVVVDAGSGVTAKAVLGITVDSGGRKLVSGMVMTNDGTLARLELLFNAYDFLAPSGASIFNYSDPSIGGDGRVYMQDVYVEKLKVGAMDFEFNLKKSISATQISQELPGGLIMKTGRYRALIGDETSMSIVFDEPFPNECRSFIPVPAINSPSIFRDLWIQIVGTPTRFGATIQTQSSTSNNNNIDGFDWTAWGT
ncbi:MAG: hypothetical protein U9R64_10310 [Pseudomonadota bacterium]|nr:hypothetical protein [Pseudomonadota bacterium]